MAALAYRENTARVNELYAEVYKGPETVIGGEQKKAKIPYVKYAFIAVCIFAALAAIIFCNMQVTELASQNSKLKSEIAELQDNSKMLSARIEKKYNLSYVEDYAKNVLGMVKLDKEAINYVDLANEARMTVAEPEENHSALLAGITRSFNIVLEYLN